MFYKAKETKINILETLANIVTLIKHGIYLCVSSKARQKCRKLRVI